MHFLRTLLLSSILFCLLAGNSVAQNKKPDPDAWLHSDRRARRPKRKRRATTSRKPWRCRLSCPPPLPRKPDRLAFQVTPLSSKGLLSQQTRDALKDLLRSNHGPIVKLRAFVAGSGDLRRVGEIAGEMFLEKHMPLPALTVVQVGALPLEGAQVVIEATEVDRKDRKSLGRCFSRRATGAQRCRVACQTEEHVLATAGMQPSDALLVTCFVSSLDDQRDTQPAMSASFPGAALDYVQMQRAPVMPAASCEATRAAWRSAASLGADSQMALVSES